MNNVKLNGFGNISEVINEMTLEEKVYLCVGGKGFSTKAIERLGIPAMNLYDGHNGVTLTQMLGELIPKVVAEMPKDDGSLKFVSDGIMKILFTVGSVLGEESVYDLVRKDVSEEDLNKLPQEAKQFCESFMENIDKALPEGGLPTCYPSGMAMGATWNQELIEECAMGVGQEAKAYDVDILLGPNVNIHRDPLGGRIFESYSEDPYLSSRIGVGYIKGLQKNGVHANVKHFIANNQETNRRDVNEIISERALREIYLPSFKAAVQEANCETLMTAYNHVNGDASSQNKYLLKDILRDEWGFDKLILSDWNGVYNQVEATKATSDLEMPGPTVQAATMEAIDNGKISEEMINDKVRHILEAIVKTHSFKGREKTAIEKEKNRNVAYETAVESFVLLKNEEKVLPMKNESAKIAAFGKYALNSLSTGAGSAGVVCDHIISTVEGLSEFYSNVKYVGDLQINEDEIRTSAKENDYAVIQIGVTTGEGSDRKTMELPEDEVKGIKAIGKAFKEEGKKVIAILNVCGPVEMYTWIENVDAVLTIWYPGQELGKAVADIISGKVSPSGKLPLTFPVKYKDTPTFLNFPGEHLYVQYAEGIFVGYRYYDYKDVAPAYEFGYGLSYTDFEYSNIKLSNDSLNCDENGKITVSVDIKNNGEYNGKEVVQLYVRDVKSKFIRPLKELKGFKKVFVKANETKTVSIDIDKEALKYYDTSLKQFIIEPGEFEILIGSSSRNIRQSISFKAVGENPYGFGLRTPIKEVVNDKEVMAEISKHVPLQVMQQPGIQIELIYHPELSFGETWEKYVKPSLIKNGKLDEAKVDELLNKICEELTKLG